jgi:hypothetical protein
MMLVPLRRSPSTGEKVVYYSKRKGNISLIQIAVVAENSGAKVERVWRKCQCDRQRERERERESVIGNFP